MRYGQKAIGQGAWRYNMFYGHRTYAMGIQESICLRGDLLSLGSTRNCHEVSQRLNFVFDNVCPGLGLNIKHGLIIEGMVGVQLLHVEEDRVELYVLLAILIWHQEDLQTFLVGSSH